MACWLLLYFRKKAYKRRVSQSEYGPETHKKNIRRKLRQKARARSGIVSNTWALPFTAGLSAPNIVFHTRKHSIASQKFKALTDAWTERYNEDPPYMNPRPVRGFWRRTGRCLKSFCCCIFGCIVDDAESLFDDDLSDDETRSLPNQDQGQGQDDGDNNDEKGQHGSESYANPNKPSTTKRKSTKEKKSTSGAVKKKAPVKEKKTSSRTPGDDKETSAKDKGTSVTTVNSTTAEATPNSASAGPPRDADDDNSDAALDAIATVDVIAVTSADVTVATELANSPTSAAGDVSSASFTPKDDNSSSSESRIA